MPRSKIEQKARDDTAFEIRWMTAFIRIQDRETGKLVPFRLNRLQRDFALKLNYQRAMGFPVRAQLLKPRKVGFSTYVSARYYMHSLLEENLKCMIIAHTTDTTETLFQMQKTIHECMPKAMFRETDKLSRKEIRFTPPHRSSMRTLTAGGKEICRGLDLHRSHFSEYHFWQPETSFISAQNAMSQGDYYEMVLESTANGAYGKSYAMWKQAEDHRAANPDDWDCWQDIFYSWLEVPWYRKAVPEGYEWGEMQHEEYELKRLGANEEQLYWRRLMLPERCNNDPDYFCQEYPATRIEAFLFSQGSVFDDRILGPHADSVEYEQKRNPPGHFKLEWVDKDRTKVEAVPSEHPFHWKIWRHPEELCDYVIGADPAGNSQSDPNDPMSKRDWSCAAVRNRRRGDYPAVYRGRFNGADEFGEEILKAAVYYGDAWVIPEVNVGDAILIPLKRYMYLYQREGSDDDVNERMLGKYGWKTTQQNRGTLIDNWKSACRKDGTWEGRKVKIYSDVCLDEERTFVYDKSGKPGHANGCHDDMLFAHMLANEGHIRLPMRYSERQWDYGHEYVPSINEIYDGMRDPGVDASDHYEDDIIETEILWT